MRNPNSTEWLWLATLIGIIAAFAAPWLELRGTFAAWRVVEWHTFWRGENSFMLSEVVAANYRMPIEFATAPMRNWMHAVFLGGAALGAWHTLAWLGLLAAHARGRRRAGASRGHVVRDIVGVLVITLLVLGALTWLFALPSSRDIKIDFRTGADVHTDSLVWSSAQCLPVAPMLAGLAALAQIIAFVQRRRTRTRW
jgi:hypothetical protein